MESQINSLETRIEKMQERFNKDLEEIKKSQYIKNNAINETNNTLEATDSRITEAEDSINEVEDEFGVSFLYSGSLWSFLYCGISSLWVGLYRWLVKVSWLGKLVSVFWWVELDFFSLE